MLQLVTSKLQSGSTYAHTDRGPVVRAPLDSPEECFGTLANELGRDLAADRMFIAWHEADHEPVYLYKSGDCTGVEQSLLFAAGEAATVDGGDAVFWSKPNINAEGTCIVTGRVSADHGTFTASAVFHRLNASKREAVRQTINRFLPLMRVFCRVWASSQRALANSRGMMAALNSSDIATILVDAEGVPVFANNAAERLIAQKDGLSRVGRKLAGRRLADTVRLQAAIEYVVHGVECAQDSTPVVSLGRNAGRPLLASIVSTGILSPEPGQAAAILHVFDPMQGLEKLLGPVCRLYGLTVVETRLALLLAEGLSLTEAANLSRIQEQTARSYLKQMFVKMDVNRQSELIGLLLRSAVRTQSNLPLTFI